MKLCRIFFSALSLALPLCMAAHTADTLRVLCIGDDLTLDVVSGNPCAMAAEDGRTVVLGCLTADGCTLEDHHGNMVSGVKAYRYSKKTGTQKISPANITSLDSALDDEKWDVITLQQSGGYSGLPTSYEPYLGDIVRYVRSKTSDKVRLMWLQTWSYANDTLHPDFVIYGRSSSDMFKAIAAASSGVVEKYGLEIIPCGAAIQTLRATYLGQHATTDGVHLNYLGQYAAASAFYAAVSGRDFKQSFRPEPMRQETKDITDQVVTLALAHPFEISWPLEYTQTALRRNYVNEDESKVTSYVLPDALTCNDGTKVRNSRQWMQKRRGELLELFSKYEYGYVPGRPDFLKFEILTEDSSALGGLATRREVRIRYAEAPEASFVMLEYVPNGAAGKVPMFLVSVFIGNQAVSDDPGVSLYSREDMDRIAMGGCLADRGTQKSRYPLEKILRSGYGFAAVYYSDICTDCFTAWERGPFKYFYKEGQTFPEADEWGAISAWAWGLSRCLDYLETDPSVDASRVAVTGHSRLGKTALWAAANDKRFAMCISSCSGCCGAAISRRKFGENFKVIISNFPHWFCRNFWEYACREDEFPVDQHELISLVAPRPVYISSGSEDIWADPKGEKMSFDEAAAVYRLFGSKACGKMGYHLHEGPHGMRFDDWDHYLEFADCNL